MHRYLSQVAMWVGCLSLIVGAAQGVHQDGEGSPAGELLVPPAPSAEEVVEEHQLPSEDPTKPGLTADQVDQMHGQTDKAPIGFEALFDGENLDNWYLSFQGLHSPTDLRELGYEEAKAKAEKNLYSVWTVKDGEIENLKPGANLVSDQNFSNFELYVDWKLTGDGNSGVFLRGLPQVQIWNNPIGSGGLANNTDLFRNPLTNRDMPPGRWNRFHIRMYGNVVTVVSNGGLVVNQGTMQNYWKRGNLLRDQGPIELQNSEGDIAFRNIFVRAISQDQSIDQEITLSNGHKVRVEKGGFSLNTVLIPMSYANAGKIVLDGVYNEPLSAYVGSSIDDPNATLVDADARTTLLEATSTGNQITITIPESLQDDDTLVVNLRILGALAQIHEDKATQQVATPSTDETN